jgi:hypothetical protein
MSVIELPDTVESWVWSARSMPLVPVCRTVTPVNEIRAPRCTWTAAGIRAGVRVAGSQRMPAWLSM